MSSIYPTRGRGSPPTSAALPSLSITTPLATISIFSCLLFVKQILTILPILCYTNIMNKTNSKRGRPKLGKLVKTIRFRLSDETFSATEEIVSTFKDNADRVTQRDIFLLGVFFSAVISKGRYGKAIDLPVGVICRMNKVFSDRGTMDPEVISGLGSISACGEITSQVFSAARKLEASLDRSMEAVESSMREANARMSELLCQYNNAKRTLGSIPG